MPQAAPNGAKKSIFHPIYKEIAPNGANSETSALQVLAKLSPDDTFPVAVKPLTSHLKKHRRTYSLCHWLMRL